MHFSSGYYTEHRIAYTSILILHFEGCRSLHDKITFIYPHVKTLYKVPRVCFSLSRDHFVSSIHSCQQQQPPLPLHPKLVVVVVRVKVCLINFSIWGGVFHTPPSTTVYILKCLLHTGRTYLRSPQFNDDDTKCQSWTAREDGVFIFIRTTRRPPVENHKSSES